MPAPAAIPRAELTALRKQRGFTVSELARLVDCSQSHLWRVENGEREPGPDLLRSLASVLGVDVATLRATQD